MADVNGTAANVSTQTGLTTDEFSKSSEATLKMQMEIAQIQQMFSLQSSVIEAQVSTTKKAADSIDSGAR